MAAMESPTSPSSFLPAQLLLHASASSGLQSLLCLSPSSDRQLAVAAAEGGHLAAANVLLRDTPLPGGVPHYNAVLPERKATTAGGTLRQPAPPVRLAAAADTPMQGAGPHTNAVPQWKPRGGELRLPASPVILAADRPEQGNGPKTNSVLDIKPRGGALRRPTPPRGAGPREGSGGCGGVIHAVADSTPQRPAAPAEGAGGNGGAFHAAPAASSS